MRGGVSGQTEGQTLSTRYSNGVPRTEPAASPDRLRRCALDPLARYHYPLRGDDGSLRGRGAAGESALCGCLQFHPEPDTGMPAHAPGGCGAVWTEYV